MSAKFEGKWFCWQAARGIGRAVTLAFLVEGAKVVVHLSKTGRAGCLEDRSGCQYRTARWSRRDVTDEAAVRQLIEKIVGKYRR